MESRGGGVGGKEEGRGRKRMDRKDRPVIFENECRWKMLEISWMEKDYPIVLKILNGITYGSNTSFMNTKKNLVTVDR